MTKTFTPPVTTSYTLTVTDNCGTVTSAPLTVTVLPPPTGVVAEATLATTVGLAWSYLGAADSFNLTPRSEMLATDVETLRTAVNAVRARAGLAVAVLTDPGAVSALPVRAVHFTELRTALAQARAILGLPGVSYSDPSLAAGDVIRAADVNELRGGVK